MKNKPKLIICIGTQKAGTSWLNSYLIQQNLCFNYENEKELHLWNSYYSGDRNHRKKLFLSSFKKLFNIGSFSRQDYFALTKQFNLLINTFYPRRFLNMASRECKIRNMPISDFTPNYCSLNSKFLNKMRIEVEQFFDLKIIFIMRDPIQRIYSWIFNRGKQILCVNDKEKLSFEDTQSSFPNDVRWTPL